jgi:hypothetical protein
MLIVAMLMGPIGSPYPGTPIVVAFVCFLIAVGVRSALLRRGARYGTPGRPHRGANVIVTVAAIAFVAVVLWVALTRR